LKNNQQPTAPCAWRISGVSFFIFGFEGEQIQKGHVMPFPVPFYFSLATVLKHKRQSN